MARAFASRRRRRGRRSNCWRRASFRNAVPDASVPATKTKIGMFALVPAHERLEGLLVALGDRVDQMIVPVKFFRKFSASPRPYGLFSYRHRGAFAPELVGELRDLHPVRRVAWNDAKGPPRDAGEARETSPSSRRRRDACRRRGRLRPSRRNSHGRRRRRSASSRRTAARSRWRERHCPSRRQTRCRAAGRPATSGWR